MTKRSWVPDHKPSYDLGGQLELSSIKHHVEIANQAGPRQLLTFTAHCGESPVRVLLDSGAQSNFISAAAAETASLGKRQLTRPFYVRHSNGSVLEVNTEVPDVELTFQHSSLCVSCIEVPRLNYDIILGQPWHRDADPQINWTTQ